MTSEMALLPREELALRPVQSIEQALALRAGVVEFTQRIMKEKIDYGTIPGTQKPTLFLPGAQKLVTHFGLTTRLEEVEKVQDWTGEAHAGEPFFCYTVRCTLLRDGYPIAEGLGSCNSWESKYRYRTVYPAKATNDEKRRAVREETRPAKNGGFYNVLVIPNEKVFDMVNTFLKMAAKRAYIAATLTALSASEFYTQDVEDFHAEASTEAQESQEAKQPAQSQNSPQNGAGSQEQAIPQEAQKQNGKKPVSGEAVAAAARFEEKARKLGYEGHMGKLAVTLLGEKPAKWSAQTWLDAIGKTATEWDTAILLHKDAEAEKAAMQAAAAPIADPVPIPEGTPGVPSRDEREESVIAGWQALYHGSEEGVAKMSQILRREVQNAVAGIMSCGDVELLRLENWLRSENKEQAA